jgi:hypothetical protein
VGEEEEDKIKDETDRDEINVWIQKFILRHLKKFSNQ